MIKNDNSKIYKRIRSANNNMLPGDPKGSPDESFFFRKATFSTSNELIKSVHKYVLLAKTDFENSSLEKHRGEK